MQLRPDGTLAPPKGYFERNWKWLVAVSLLLGVLLVTIFVGGIFLAILGSMKSSDAYKMAVAKAKANGEVISALGTPIEEGWFISGNISVNGPSGNAELSIPLEGPKGKGTLFLEAKKSAGQWTFSLLEVEVKGSDSRIDLLAAPFDLTYQVLRDQMITTMSILVPASVTEGQLKFLLSQAADEHQDDPAREYLMAEFFWVTAHLASKDKVSAVPAGSLRRALPRGNPVERKMVPPESRRMLDLYKIDLDAALASMPK